MHEPHDTRPARVAALCWPGFTNFRGAAHPVIRCDAVTGLSKKVADLDLQPQGIDHCSSSFLSCSAVVQLPA